MKNEYQIEKDGQITTVNSKEEYEAFKKKYNSYDFVVMERTNKVKMISKNDKHPKTPKGMPEWFRIWKDTELEARFNKIEEILMRHEEILMRHEEILMRHEEILNKHSEIFKRNNLS